MSIEMPDHMKAAEELRRAAARATDGPWHISDSEWWGIVSDDLHTPVVDAVCEETDDRGKANAEYLVLMDPRIGLAVASWLEDVANGHAPADARADDIALAILGL